MYIVTFKNQSTFQKKKSIHFSIHLTYFCLYIFMSIYIYHFMANRWGNSGNSVRLSFWAPKSLQMVTAAMKLKDAYSLEGSWWWTGRPSVLQFMGLQRVGHDWVTELNWTYTKYILVYCIYTIYNLCTKYIYMLFLEGVNMQTSFHKMKA